jgi:streptogramin lyase
MRSTPTTFGLLLAALCQAGIAAAAPQVDAPALVVFHSQDYSADNPDRLVLTSINGTGFGAPQNGTFRRNDCGLPAAGSFVIIRRGQSVLQIAESTDPDRVHSWTDRQIVLKLSTGTANRDNLNFEVCTPTGASGAAAAGKWTYTHFDVPGTSDTNAEPLAVARDAAGSTWVNEEFHTRLKRLNASNQWTVLQIPQVAGPGIFALVLPGFDAPSRISAAGEDIIVDTLGRVWFSQGGSAPYDGPNPNHSRIVMYDPATQQMRAYNVPGDDNGVFGLAWDPTWQRIWFTQLRRSVNVGSSSYTAQHARITSFLPAYTPYDNYFAFTPTETCNVPGGQYVGTCSTHTFRSCINERDCVLAERVCPPGTVYDYWCFHEHEIPDSNGGVLLPAHVLQHSDGTVWYSAYWGGNHLGRLDPTTDTFQVFPLPQPSDQATCNYGSCDCFFDTPNPPCPARCCSYLLLGAGPWSVVEAPNHDVILSYQNEGAVGRFSYAQLQANPATCMSLDVNGQNPCLTNHVVPEFNPDEDFHHSAALDAAGNAWITQFHGVQDDCTGTNSIAMLQAGTNRMLRFPPFAFYPAGSPCKSFGPAGMAFDPTIGAMWFTDYWRKRLGQLSPTS